MKRSLALAALLALVATPFASAASAITMADGWASPATTSAAVYGTIANADGAPDRLLGAMTPNAGTVELHDALHGPAPVAALIVPAHGVLTLAPGGAYISIGGLKAPIAAGDAFLLRLHFERTGYIVAIVRVRSTGGGALTTGPAPMPAVTVAPGGPPVIPVPHIATPAPPGS